MNFAVDGAHGFSNLGQVKRMLIDQEIHLKISAKVAVVIASGLMQANSAKPRERASIAD